MAISVSTKAMMKQLCRADAGNVLYATALLMPVMIGGGVVALDAAIWYLGSSAIESVANEAAQAGYAAYEDGGDEEKAVETVFMANNQRLGNIHALEVDVERDGKRNTVLVDVQTELFLPISSGFMGKVMILSAKGRSGGLQVAAGSEVGNATPGANVKGVAVEYDPSINIPDGANDPLALR